MIDIEDSEHALWMLRRWLEGVMASRAPNEVIQRSGSKFFERWFLARKATIATFISTYPGLPDDLTPMKSEIENCYVHRFARDDHEDMHCHPWDNASMVVKGRYMEETPEGEFLRRPGQIVIRRANQRHAIINVEPGTVSLFATGPKVREWGFWPEADTFVHWRDYDRWCAERDFQVPA